MLILPHGKWGKSGYNTKIYKSFWRTRFINKISQNFTIAEKIPKALPPIFQILNAKKQCQSEKGQKTNTNPPISHERLVFWVGPPPFPPPPLFWHGKCFAIILFMTKRSKDCTLYQHLILRYWILIWKWFPGSWKVLLTIPTCHELGILEGCIVKRNHDSFDTHLI